MSLSVSGSSCGWSCVSYCDSSNLTREFTTARLLRSQKKETIILFNPSFKCGKSRVLKFYAKSQPSHLCIYIYIYINSYIPYVPYINSLYFQRGFSQVFGGTKSWVLLTKVPVGSIPCSSAITSQNLAPI